MTSYNIERGEELKGSVDIKTPFAGYEKLGAEASIEFKSPTEFDFKVRNSKEFNIKVFGSVKISNKNGCATIFRIIS